MNIVRVIILSFIKLLARCFYRFDVIDINTRKKEWSEIKLALLLNHTSLFEPLFLGALPWGFIRRTAYHGALPGADITLDRPLVGRFYKLLAPHVISITRKRDRSWTEFLKRSEGNTMVVLAPEGRMKRPDGLDKFGQPMTIKGGVVDLLLLSEGGKMLLGYSGGLHQVQSPGEFRVRPFKRLKIAYEILDIDAYKKEHGSEGDRKEFLQSVIKDLEERRERHCPVN